VVPGLFKFVSVNAGIFLYYDYLPSLKLSLCCGGMRILLTVVYVTMSWLTVTITTDMLICSVCRNHNPVLEVFSYSQISLNSRTFTTIYSEFEKAEFPPLGILNVSNFQPYLQVYMMTKMIRVVTYMSSYMTISYFTSPFCVVPGFFKLVSENTGICESVLTI
jgi:hypothetical protein